ncbi:MAG: hypothetical protein V4729_13315 [Pseudomonadota bacterium]
MIELFRHYWWAALSIAALIVVVTHAGLVKLLAVLQENERKAAGNGDEPPARQ